MEDRTVFRKATQAMFGRHLEGVRSRRVCVFEKEDKKGKNPPLVFFLE